jgi:hypothetical protein
MQHDSTVLFTLYLGIQYHKRGSLAIALLGYFCSQHPNRAASSKFTAEKWERKASRCCYRFPRPLFMSPGGICGFARLTAMRPTCIIGALQP